MKAIEREYERRVAGLVARLITKAHDLRRRADTANSAKERALIESAKKCDSMIGFYIATSENPGRFLRVVTKAVEGKPIWSKIDAAINEVIRKYGELQTISEMDNKLAVVLTQRGINKTTKKAKHDRDALRRRLNARGYRYSVDKPGRKNCHGVESRDSQAPWQKSLANRVAALARTTDCNRSVPA